MAHIRIISEKDGVRTVTDGEATWREFPSSRQGPIHWFEDEVLLHPTTFYTKALNVLFHFFFLVPLSIPVYQVAFIHLLSPWVGLSGWAWWQTAIKLTILGMLWAPVIFLHIWVAQSSVRENGIDFDD